MKKIISFVLAAAMSLSTLPALADWNNDEDIMSLLSELNIMVGAFWEVRLCLLSSWEMM